YYLAQHNLAIAYEEGNGIAQDLIEAYVWITLAEENSRNLKISPDRRQEIQATMERIESELTKEQLKEALMKLENYRTTILVIPATRQPLF
ncbi:MAG: SEL1-like repeat protein, partial [Alphaproteobacteria bacterium]|nr:SEL1-like repeat protein [Alphaproteobacteria bacterium]